MADPPDLPLLADPDHPERGGRPTALGLVALTDGDRTIVWVTDLRTGAPLAGVRVHGADRAVVAISDRDGVVALPATDRVEARRGDDAAWLPVPPVVPAGAVLWWADPGSNVAAGEDLERIGVVRGPAGTVPDVDVDWVAEGEWGESYGEGTARPDRFGVVRVRVKVPAAGRVRLRATVDGVTGVQVLDPVRSSTHPGLALHQDGDAVVLRAAGEGGPLAGARVRWEAVGVPEDRPVPGWIDRWFDADAWPREAEAEGTTDPDGCDRFVLPAWDGPGTWRVTAQLADDDRVAIAVGRTPPPIPLPGLGGTDEASRVPLTARLRRVGPDTIVLAGPAPFLPAEVLVTSAGGRTPAVQRMRVTEPTWGVRLRLPPVPAVAIRVDMVGERPRDDEPGSRPAWASLDTVVRGGASSLVVRIAPCAAAAPGTVVLVSVDVADATGRPASGARVLLVVRDAQCGALGPPALRAPPSLAGAHGRAWLRSAPHERLPGPPATPSLGSQLEPTRHRGRPGLVLEAITDARGRARLPWTVGGGPAAWDLRAVALEPDGRFGSAATRCLVRWG